MKPIQRALVSVSDKAGLIDFLSPLVKKGLEVVSTGGTLEFLKKNQIPAIDISAVTNFPEVLDGRVKTLHPFVHMGLLADQRNPKHLEQLQKHDVKSFDLVVGNLYPFEQAALDTNSTEEQLIEKIDIGGPSFLRSSAKNYHSVIVVCDPQDYSWIQTKILADQVLIADRQKLAMKVFSLTSYYDALIVQKLSAAQAEHKYLNLPLKLKSELRYGENAHQKASWYENPLQINSLSQMQIHQGKELSYNNLLDLDAAWGLVQQFKQAACIAVKHNNPCGAAVASTLLEASQKAIQSDPKSIFGGIIAFNQVVDIKVCEAFSEIFLECVIAPQFTAESLQFLSAKKNLRVLSLPLKNYALQSLNYKSISGGALVQQSDSFIDSNWKILGDAPTTEILETMKFGEKVVGFLKSNAIAIVARGQTIGLGMGQVNRVDAVQQALSRLQDYQQRQTLNMSDVVLVSDAFFPFPDSVELISQFGLRWIVQPGGSAKDQLVIEAAQKNKINMVLTEVRHFRH